MDRRAWKEPVDERIVAEGVFLEHRAVLRITNGAGLLIAAHAGTLWITEEGDRRDVIVTNGRSYRIKSDGLTIVNALEHAIVTISARLGLHARWTIDGATAIGLPNGVRIRPRSHDEHGTVGRTLWAWVLRRYRSGAHLARRAQESVREATLRADIARFAAQLDPRTRKDIGLDEYYGSSPAERAEQYRWSHDYAWPARESRFI
jgi:DUF2917 family protein